MKQVIPINSVNRRENLANYIRRIDIEAKLQVVIGPQILERSAAQNSLYWAWLTDCEKTENNEHAGSTKYEWHRRFKEMALLNIFTRDNVDGTAQTMAVLYNSKKAMGIDDYTTLREFVIHKISTTDCDIAQFTEYLTDIQRYCDHHQIYLRTDNENFSKAMGKK